MSRLTILRQPKYGPSVPSDHSRFAIARTRRSGSQYAPPTGSALDEFQRGKEFSLMFVPKRTPFLTMIDTKLGR